MGFQLWRSVPGKTLLILLNIFSAIALVYEGYNQGVYGAISGTPGFVKMSNLATNSNGAVTDTTKQGGLAAAYYFGAMFGGFIGGWAGDKFGRKKGAFMGAVLSLLGSVLQAGSVNANMFICARVIAGLGIGFINVLIPSWVSELSEAHDRGSNFSLVFVANFLGIFLANWINFGVRKSNPAFEWRFPLGFMCIPMLLVAVTVVFVPGEFCFQLSALFEKGLRYFQNLLDGLWHIIADKRRLTSFARFEATKMSTTKTS